MCVCVCVCVCACVCVCVCVCRCVAVFVLTPWLPACRMLPFSIRHRYGHPKNNVRVQIVILYISRHPPEYLSSGTVWLHKNLKLPNARLAIEAPWAWGQTTCYMSLFQPKTATLKDIAIALMTSTLFHRLVDITRIAEMHGADLAAPFKGRVKRGLHAPASRFTLRYHCCHVFVVACSPFLGSTRKLVTFSVAWHDEIFMF